MGMTTHKKEQQNNKMPEDRPPRTEEELRQFALYNIVANAEKGKWIRKTLLPRLQNAGLFYRAYKTTTKKEVVVEIFSSMERLEKEAQRTQVRVEMDSHVLEKVDIDTNKKLQDLGLNFKPPSHAGEKPSPYEKDSDLAIPGVSAYPWVSPSDPYKHIFAPFIDFPAGSAKRNLYTEDRRSHHPIGNRLAIVLLVSILEAPRTEGGAELDLEQLTEDEKVVASFPALAKDQKKSMWDKWIVWCAIPWSQPVEEIRRVFGEQVAMYFSFLSTMTAMLVIPAVLGMALFANQVEAETPSVIWLPVYGVVVALWTTAFMEIWKRSESRNAAHWGTTGYEAVEKPRPAFLKSQEVSYKRSPVTGKPEYYRNPILGSAKLSISSFLIGLLIGIVIVLVLTVFFVRALLIHEERQGRLSQNWGGYIGSIIQALVIMVMDKAYAWFARFLTDFENQPTDSAYDASRNIKAFAFQFINSYYALAWIITAKQAGVVIFGEEQTCVPDCLTELQNALGTIFLTRVLVNNAQELFLPTIMSYVMALWKRIRGPTEEEKLLDSTPADKISEAERHKDLPLFDVNDEYLEQVILYGYATLFVTAFPLAPLILLLNNYLEMRVDGIKLLSASNRPVPRPASSSGPWIAFFDIVSNAAVVTNLILVVFTAKDGFFGIKSAAARLVTFVILEHFFLAIKYGISRLVPDADYETKTLLARQEYLVDKHIRDVPDPIVSATGTDAETSAEESVAEMAAASAEADVLIHESLEDANATKNPFVEHYLNVTAGATESKDDN